MKKDWLVAAASAMPPYLEFDLFGVGAFGFCDWVLGSVFIDIVGDGKVVELLPFSGVAEGYELLGDFCESGVGHGRWAKARNAFTNERDFGDLQAKGFYVDGFSSA
ncbi:hypothetical protein QEH56_23850 [Pelagicoccus enzymogenes]|uniref:hypothetical protein n=1 Tax=Pelagicoccus enzymogenes TaxID=2773457 RepID=UPI00280CDFBA|nr:hypothetical protein [Pelagicoccus enzymogenes]MDQ8201220.1 hypothetical protein [Pelagicoccus enzymogenes]